MSTNLKENYSQINCKVEEAFDELTGKNYLPPCQIACPVGEDIQRTNVLIASLPSDIRDAYSGIIRIGDEIYQKNPFFMICGYICGLCEKECNYKDKGGSIRRRLLKRFISDYYLNYLKKKEKLDVPKKNLKVAIIGGGPGGLMCAYELSKRGYNVTIFERSGNLGGAIRLIPKYRLPENVLNETIDNLVRIAGIEVRLNTEVKSLKELEKESYKAVFIATGTPYPRALTFEGKEVKGTDLENVFQGIEFLWEVNREKIPQNIFENKKVIVIGGGNVAFDVARTARRFGGNVEIVCLECEDKTSKDGIPADEEEIEGAHEEGIKINYSRGVSEIIGENGKFKKIKCPKCISVFDETGFNPKFNKDDFIYLEGDVLIITIGQGPDRAFYQKEGLLNERGRLQVDPVTLESLKKGIFIGGDVKKIGFAAEAMRDGIIAAESIDRYLRGVDLKIGREKRFEKTEMPKIVEYKEPTKVAYFRSKDRINSFELFEKGFTLQEAIKEAKRCACCGPCVSCKACVLINLQPEIRRIEVNKEKCSGCGICVSVCPYSAIELKTENSNIISTTDELKCKRCGLCVTSCPSEAREIKDNLDSTIEEIYETLSKPIIKGKILIVDDEEIIRRSLSEWFENEGYKTHLAEDGYSALRTLSEKEIDAVFLDLKMPGMDGIEVLKKIKEKNLCKNVIMITAYGTIQNAVEAMKIGALDYVVKPFEPEDLQKVVENVVGV
jgi:NADPH-dependent glutamate synthase beta subunit-like oxidoreductase/CheY-like chemotaxis protein